MAAALLCAATARAQARPPTPPGGHKLIDVPYLSQTPELCGGAAVAMVLRYWGARDVFAQDFAPLVGPEAGGILTNTLALAVVERGWQAYVLPDTDTSVRARVQRSIDRGRPLIALMEVGPRTFHYVVIVGITEHEVVLHDPARGPWRVLPWSAFDQVWTAAGRWALLVLPPGAGVATGDAASMLANRVVAAVEPQSACDLLVEHQVGVAVAGDADTAEQGLLAASRLCPLDAAPLRELAGLRFSQRRWSDARDLARAATGLAPDDVYAWQLLGSSRFLLGDAVGALDAWNHAGEPRVDTMTVSGAMHTRPPVLVRAAGLEPRQLLTPTAYERAVRRLRDVPAAASAYVRYQPTDDGRAHVDLVVDERPTIPKGWPSLVSLGARAALLREVSIDVPGGMGAGEREAVRWRWASGRPSVGLEFALPSPAGLPGVLAVEGLWDRQSYSSLSEASGVAHERRQRMALSLADWSTSRLRWSLGMAVDRWRTNHTTTDARETTRAFVAVDGSLDLRLAGDRVALGMAGSGWQPMTGRTRVASSSLLAAWRSTRDEMTPTWSVASAIAFASAGAPMGLWPGAGTGVARGLLLRAHPLLTGGVLDGPAFGRFVAQSSVEYDRPVRVAGVPGVAVAAFTDAARASGRPGRQRASTMFIDAGMGLRLRVPGSAATVRIDVARGVRGGGATVSAAWVGAWPR